MERQKPSTRTSGQLSPRRWSPGAGRGARPARRGGLRQPPAEESDASSTWRPSVSRAAPGWYRAVVAHHDATDGAAGPPDTAAASAAADGDDIDSKKSATVARCAGVKRPYQSRLTE